MEKTQNPRPAPHPHPVALFLGWLCLLGASMNNDDVMMLAVAEASLSAGLPVSRGCCFYPPVTFGETEAQSG